MIKGQGHSNIVTFNLINNFRRYNFKFVKLGRNIYVNKLYEIRPVFICHCDRRMKWVISVNYVILIINGKGYSYRINSK
jgi:hypothetical protein